MPAPLELVAAVDFGTLLFLGGTVFVAAIWTLLPFSLFGVRGRLETIEKAKRDQTEMLVGEVRQIQAGFEASLGTR